MPSPPSKVVDGDVTSRVVRLQALDMSKDAAYLVCTLDILHPDLPAFKKIG